MVLMGAVELAKVPDLLSSVSGPVWASFASAVREICAQLGMRGVFADAVVAKLASESATSTPAEADPPGRIARPTVPVRSGRELRGLGRLRVGELRRLLGHPGGNRRKLIGRADQLTLDGGLERQCLLGGAGP